MKIMRQEETVLLAVISLKKWFLNMDIVLNIDKKGDEKNLTNRLLNSKYKQAHF